MAIHTSASSSIISSSSDTIEGDQIDHPSSLAAGGIHTSASMAVGPPHWRFDDKHLRRAALSHPRRWARRLGRTVSTSAAAAIVVRIVKAQDRGLYDATRRVLYHGVVLRRRDGGRIRTSRLLHLLLPLRRRGRATILGAFVVLGRRRRERAIRRPVSVRRGRRALLWRPRRGLLLLLRRRRRAAARQEGMRALILGRKHGEQLLKRRGARPRQLAGAAAPARRLQSTYRLIERLGRVGVSCRRRRRRGRRLGRGLGRRALILVLRRAVLLRNLRQRRGSARQPRPEGDASAASASSLNARSTRRPRSAG